LTAPGGRPLLPPFVIGDGASPFAVDDDVTGGGVSDDEEQPETSALPNSMHPLRYKTILCSFLGWLMFIG
jgi:hypothetical protein